MDHVDGKEPAFPSRWGNEQARVDHESREDPRFLTTGAGSVWTLKQGDGTISRVDTRSGKLLATIEAGLSGRGGEIAYGEGSIWATLFGFPITRIDPATNRVMQQWTGKGGRQHSRRFGVSLAHRPPLARRAGPLVSLR